MGEEESGLIYIRRWGVWAYAAQILPLPFVLVYTEIIITSFLVPVLHVHYKSSSTGDLTFYTGRKIFAK